MENIRMALLFLVFQLKMVTGKILAQMKTKRLQKV